MGGCCCCSSKGVGLNSSPAFYYYPRVSEERVPLSPQDGTVSAISTSLLFNTNLETSVPDTYRPPPAPLPYDANPRRPRTPPINEESCGNKHGASVLATNAESVEQPTAGNNALGTSDEDLKKSGCKVQKDTELVLPNDMELELEKPGEHKKSNEPLVSVVEEEDVCPTCLEEYDAENPRIITKCEHHFHLACILEWMERSDTCPVCGQEMIFDPPVDS